MCGIAGFSGRFAPPLLEAMSDVIAHRGPDSKGDFFDAEHGVGLAHRRLAIIDLSPAGHQPMLEEEAGLALVYNGELYNFRELRRELEAAGVRFRSTSDTEVILRAYREWGPDALSRFSGIFAFAIWDRPQRRLLLARDPLGVKPLYYSSTSEGFLFGSEMKSLLQSDAVDRSIDLAGLDAYLHFLWSPSPNTMLAGVHKLPPGSAMLVENGSVTKSWTYYSLPIQARPTIQDEEEARSVAQSKLRSSVGRQMVADVPVGAFLSGGLDSSTIVALARETAPEGRVECFTIGFEGAAEGMDVDLRYAEEVARDLGVPLHVVRATPKIVEQLPEMIYHLDEPQADPAAIHTMAIAGLARERGIKVLLSGTGGDDLFSGYRRHAALLAERWWAWAPQSIRSAVAAASGALPNRPSAARRLRKALAGAGLPPDERMAAYFSWMPPAFSRSVFSGDGRRTLATRSPLSPLLEALHALPSEASALDRMLHLDTRFFLADHNLNYTDKMAMACGVEVRVPLIDTELVAFAAELPVRFKFRDTTSKWILREAARPLLPESVLRRRKVGFGAPLREWMQGPLRSLLADTLSEPTLRSRGLFDPSEVARMQALDAAGRIDAAYVLFAIVCVELWCRTFVDGPVPRRVVL